MAENGNQQGGGTALARQDQEKALSLKEAHGLLTREDVFQQIEMAVAKTIDTDRLIRTALTAMSRNPDLLGCTPGSWILALQEAGSLGLEPTGVLGHAYLIPRWNKKTRSMEAQFQIGYQGLRALARRSPEITNVVGEVVREGDEFRYQKGAHPDLVHIPIQSVEVRPMTHVYAISFWEGDYIDFEVMNRAQVDAIRARSQAKDSGPWVTDYDEMARKTVLRLHCKHLPLEPEAQAVLAYDAEAEYGHGQERVKLARFMAEDVGQIPPPVSDTERAASATRQKVQSLKTQMGQQKAPPPPPPPQQPKSDAEHGREIQQAVEDELPDVGGEPEQRQADPPPPPPKTKSHLQRARDGFFAAWKEHGEPSGRDRHEWQEEYIGKPSSKQFTEVEFRRAKELLEKGVGLDAAPAAADDEGALPV